MTDFLSGLLDRAFNRVPVLQPRRPSLFEPLPSRPRFPAPVTGPLWRQEKEDPNSDLETIEMRESPQMRQFAAPPHADARPRPAVSQVAPLVDLSLRTPIPALSPPRQKTQDIPREVTGDSLERQTVNAVVMQMRHRASDQGPAETRHYEHQVETDEPVDRPRVLTRRKRKSEHRHVEAQEKTGIQQLPRLKNSFIAPEFSLDREQEVRKQPPTSHQAQASEAKRGRDLPTPQVQFRERTVQPSIVPLAVPAPRPALPSRQRTMVRETRQIEPSIQVTIGRIEVRGSLPAPVQTSVPRPTTPKLGLEDYLRSRSGGAK